MSRTTAAQASQQCTITVSTATADPLTVLLAGDGTGSDSASRHRSG